MQFFSGLLLGILIAVSAWRVGALSRSGAWAAALTGGLIFGLGGLAWTVLLLAFFISSSALSRLFARRKDALNEKFSKGSRRDWGQVFANGGLGMLLVLVWAAFPDWAWLWVAYAGAMAAVNADTWATELGVLSCSSPRLITSGRRVERGTSGAISLSGSLAACGGAALIAVCAAFFTPGAALVVFFATVVAGIGGSFFDSFLGATVQAIFCCPVCQKETERHPLHTCGATTVQQRGWRWLDNDMVNFVASLVGAAIAAGIWAMFSRG